MPLSLWKAPLVSGNGVVVVVLGGDGEMEPKLENLREMERDMNVRPLRDFL